MSDITVKYRNQTILETSTSGIRYLKTSGKVCDDDITIRYQRPTAEPPDTSKIVYDVMDKGETIVVNGCLCMGENLFICPSKNGVYFKPDFSQPFEIGVVFKLFTMTTRNQAVFGNMNYGTTYVQRRRRPTVSINESGSGDLIAYFSTDGTSWEKTLTLPDGTVTTGTWYHLRYIWDGSIFKVGISTDFETYIEDSVEQTTGHYNENRNGFLFGRRQDYLLSNNSYIEDGVINLQGTYIKSNGELVWGCTYCVDEKTFDYL